MRLRILIQPIGTIDGISLDRFRIGSMYELGTQVACVFLAEGWAELIDGHDPDPLVRPPPDIAIVEPLLLVVDDDPEVRRLTESLLTAHGYHVVVAAHGKDGLQRLRERCPDLIVLDLNMPVMDGWEFRSEQRYLSDKKCAAVPVLIMTGDDDAATRANTLQAAGIIMKPLDPDDLLDAVSAAIRSPGAPDGIRSPRAWRKSRQPRT